MLYSGVKQKIALKNTHGNTTNLDSLLILNKMVEWLGGTIDAWLNTTGPIWEGAEVSEEDLIRVSESLHQAKVVHQQIQWAHQKNRKLADFLNFLMQEVKNDQIWKVLIELCTVQDSTWLNLTLALQELVAFFAPFFQEQAEQHGVYELFQNIPHVDHINSKSYKSYIEEVSTHSSIMKDMEKEKVDDLVELILGYFGHHAAPDNA